MRTFLVSLVLGVSSMLAWGGEPTNRYDIYVLACDNGTDCLRVVDVDVDHDGRVGEFSGPGVSLRIDTLASNSDSTTVKLSVNLVPHGLAFSSLGTRKEAANARIAFQIEPCTIKREQFAVIATFSGGNKIYQVWGRATSRQGSQWVASR